MYCNLLSIGADHWLDQALLSRFDIMWLILDKADGERDKELSQHILHVHRFGSPPQPEEGTHLSPDQLRSYITAAKAFEPEIPKELAGVPGKDG